MTSTTKPILAAPGAGLPLPELLIARLLFAVKCRTKSREDFEKKFRDERASIRSLVDACETPRRGETVLIKRLRGLEDSSRDWSVWMTLDHLRITNLAFAHFISTLSEGRSPNVVVNTANVKPDPAVTGEIESAYEKSCDDFLATLAKVSDLKTGARQVHPWFGPLDAFQWLALASMHMGIHRSQISAIIADLPK